MNGFSDYYTGAEYKPVRRYVAKRIVKAALVSAAFEAVFLGIGFFWSSHTGFGAGWLAIPLMGIIGLSGVKISGLLSLLTDRPCEGRIIEIRETTEDKTNTVYGQMINFDQKVSKLSVYVQKTNGDVRLFETKFDKTPHDYYREGDEVRHYRGLHLFEKKDKSGDEKLICQVCESYVSISEDHCPFCKYKLLK